MVDIREVLRRWQAGFSERRTSRETGADRKTVKRYVDAAKAVGVAPGQELTDEVVAQVARRVQGREPPPPSEPWQVLSEHKERIAKWLEGPPPLKLSKVHVLLGRNGVDVTYPTLRRFVQQELAWRQAPATVLLADPPPGQEAQVDFGRAGMIPTEDGPKVLWVLLVTLSASRYMFVWPTLRQTTEAVCEGLDEAWMFFGGVPKTLLPDNMAAMVDVADPLGVRLVPAFADYVQARQVLVDAARVRHPRDKARVENAVAYVRESWFGGEELRSLEDARASARQWCLEVAGRRVHGTTRKVPREVYESVEKPAMQPAPTAHYDVPVWVDAKVHPDHHVQVARGLYSVPTRYLGQKVRVRADRKVVKIFVGAELVKMHGRVGPGERSTDPADYPTGKEAYALRSVDGLIKRARNLGEHVGRYAERVLGGPLPWTRMRQAYALLHLCERYSAERVDAVCQSALGFDVVDVPRISRMVKKAVTAAQQAEPGKVVPLLAPPRFARPAEHFSTQAKAADGKGES